MLLKVELNSNSVVAQEHIDMAVKFGVDLGDLTDPIETQKYVLALSTSFYYKEKNLIVNS